MTPSAGSGLGRRDGAGRLRLDRDQQRGVADRHGRRAAARGPGTVAFSVAANTATTARTGTLTIGGQTFTVTQAGAPTCAVTVSPGDGRDQLEKGEPARPVTNPTGCAWTAASSAAWLTVTNAQVSRAR